MPRLVVVGRSTRGHLEFYSPIAEEVAAGFTAGRRQAAWSRSCACIQGEHSDQVGKAGKVGDVVREDVVNIVGHHRRHDVGIVDLVAGYGMLPHQCQEPLSNRWPVLCDVEAPHKVTHVRDKHRYRRRSGDCWERVRTARYSRSTCRLIHNSPLSGRRVAAASVLP